jgi:hypothetical protein
MANPLVSLGVLLRQSVFTQPLPTGQQPLGPL